MSMYIEKQTWLLIFSQNTYYWRTTCSKYFTYHLTLVLLLAKMIYKTPCTLDKLVVQIPTFKEKKNNVIATDLVL